MKIPGNPSVSCYLEILAFISAILFGLRGIPRKVLGAFSNMVPGIFPKFLILFLVYTGQGGEAQRVSDSNHQRTGTSRTFIDLERTQNRRPSDSLQTSVWLELPAERTDSHVQRSHLNFEASPVDSHTHTVHSGAPTSSVSNSLSLHGLGRPIRPVQVHIDMPGEHDNNSSYPIVHRDIGDKRSHRHPVHPPTRHGQQSSADNSNSPLPSARVDRIVGSSHFHGTNGASGRLDIRTPIASMADRNLHQPSVESNHDVSSSPTHNDSEVGSISSNASGLHGSSRNGNSVIGEPFVTGSAVGHFPSASHPFFFHRPRLYVHVPHLFIHGSPHRMGHFFYRIPFRHHFLGHVGFLPVPMTVFPGRDRRIGFG